MNATSSRKKQRAFLKWAGGKFNLVDAIIGHLPAADILVEPFVGAGSVFLNTDYQHYVLNDINADLIHLYCHLQQNAVTLIDDAKALFRAENNDKATFIAMRQQFNQTVDPYQRALFFLFLNRHCYNGLCRYNQSGAFNVPFGSYKKPYFPQAELEAFAQKSQKATFTCQSYQQVFANLPPQAAVYCDPPYVALSKTANFTSYAKNSFNLDDQADLANLAEQAQQQGHHVLISNHDTSWTRKIYHAAELHSIQVGRSISQKGSSRGKVAELFALYRASAQHSSTVE